MLLTGCTQQPASSDVSGCEPTSSFEVQHEGTGTGPVVTDGGVVTFTVDVYDDKGALVAEGEAVRPDESGKPMPVPMGGLTPGLVEMMRCGQAGETLTAKIPNKNFFPEAALSSGQVDPEGSQHLAVHIERVYHSSAAGRIAPQQNGIPAVVNAPGGGHGVTIPKEPSPTERRVATTISGFGEPLKQDEIAVVQMTAFAWGTGEELFNTWENPMEAMMLPASAGEVFTLGDALIGTRVGSQLVVVVPAAQLAESSPGTGTPFGGGDAVVFVVDVLGKA